MLTNIEEVTGERIDIFTNVPLCFKIIAFTYVAATTAVSVAAYSLVVDDLPVSVLYTLKRLGLIPESFLPTIDWKLGCFPLELLITVPPVCAFAFNGHVVVKGLVIPRLIQL